MRRRGNSEPWWLEVGTEICPVCHHLYLYETQHRCSHCDDAVCSNCVDDSAHTCAKCRRKHDESEASIDIDINLEV